MRAPRKRKHRFMKKWPALLLALALPATAAPAQENRYELLGHILRPIAGIFADDDNGQPRALDAELTLTEMTGVPPALVGGRLRVAIQYPDKCLVEGLLLAGGTDGVASITICRAGQQVWVHPGSLARMLIAQAGELPKRKKSKARLDDFALPFPEKHLVFLPILFEIEDAGEESLAGQQCRLLDLRLMPELARGLRVEDWSAQVAVRPDSKLARLILARPGWRIAVAVDRMGFAAELPPQTWQPTAAQSDDLLRLDAVECERLLQALDRRFRGKPGKR
jgi:hypothetical protein